MGDEDRNNYKLTVWFSTDESREVFPHGAPDDPVEITTLLLERVNSGDYRVEGAQFQKVKE